MTAVLDMGISLEHAFDEITDNREKLMGDYNALTDPKVVEAIEEEGVILTSWKELMERRQKVK